VGCGPGPSVDRGVSAVRSQAKDSRKAKVEQGEFDGELSVRCEVLFGIKPSVTGSGRQGG
jgi:hypothetical protein